MNQFNVGSRAILHIAPGKLSRYVGEEGTIRAVFPGGLFCGVEFDCGVVVNVPMPYLKPVEPAKTPRRSPLTLKPDADTRTETERMDKQLSLPSIPAKLRPRKSRESGYKRRQPEFEEQCRLFAFLRQYAERDARLGYVFAIPNGLALQPKVAAAAVAQGVKAGVWDIAVPFSGVWEGARFPLLFIEMKYGKNKLTPSQQDFNNNVGGYAFVVAYSWVEAAKEIVSYLGIEDLVILRAVK